MTAKLTFVHALSPLHAGTGQGVGVIDLPIAREKATNIPYLPGSSLKGTLRDLCTSDLKTKVFGPETNQADLHAGSAVFSDQRLLLLPVRSLRGTFAWATSPYILQRFKRDAEGAEVTEVAALPNVTGIAESQCYVSQSNSALIYQSGDQSQVILEDLDLQAEKKNEVDKWAEWLGKQLFTTPNWQAALQSRLCILSDNVFNFLLEHGTEITARIKLLSDKKTVQKGGLWYEEALPAETVLSGLLVAVKGQATPKEVSDTISKIVTDHKAIQLGGKATVGRGLCSVHLK